MPFNIFPQRFVLQRVTVEGVSGSAGREYITLLYWRRVKGTAGISERKWDQKLLPYCVTVFVAQYEVVVEWAVWGGGRVWVHI